MLRWYSAPGSESGAESFWSEQGWARCVEKHSLPLIVLRVDDGVTAQDAIADMEHFKAGRGRPISFRCASNVLHLLSQTL